MAKKKSAPDAPKALTQPGRTIYQLKMSLNGITPPIWRRVQVDADTPLNKLHVIIQFAMGWEDIDVHHFVVGDKVITELEAMAEPDPAADESQILLFEVAPNEKDSFTYVYAEPAWEHTIEVEEILPAKKRQRYPICLDGARACPVEQLPDNLSYDEVVAISANPKHPKFKDILYWLGEPFDPEAFSVAQVNDELLDVDGYIEELEMLKHEVDMFGGMEMPDPEDIETLREATHAALNAMIVRVGRLSNGYMLTLDHTPTSVAASVQFIMLYHEGYPDLKLGVEVGPAEAIVFKITGPKEILAEVTAELDLRDRG